MNYAQKRKQARNFFVFNHMTAKDIADVLKVQEKTVGKWRKEDQWDKERDEVMTNPNEIRKVLLAEMKNISSGGDAKIDADSLSKISKVLEALSDKVSPQAVFAILQLLDNFLADHHPELAVQSLEPHKEFLRHIISLHDQ